MSEDTICTMPQGTVATLHDNIVTLVKKKSEITKCKRCEGREIFQCVRHTEWYVICHISGGKVFFFFF